MIIVWQVCFYDLGRFAALVAFIYIYGKACGMAGIGLLCLRMMILVDFIFWCGGMRLLGFVDWETVGWYPEYWEYTTACQVNPQNSFWISEIHRFLDPMPEELAMDRIRQKYFGDITF